MTDAEHMQAYMKLEDLKELSQAAEAADTRSTAEPKEVAKFKRAYKALQGLAKHGRRDALRTFVRAQLLGAVM